MKLLPMLNVILILITGIRGSHFRLTNIECKIKDPSFVDIKECILKMVRRNVAGMRIHWAIKYQPPIDQIQLNMCIFRKSNVYRLFMVNHTLDFCYYMKNPQMYPVFYIFHESLLAASNANHTCPYLEKDIYFNRMLFDEKAVRNLPLPDGEYKLSVNVGAFKVWRMQVNVYGVLLK
ncbi:hypothetical protein KR018_011326 [Drosophila ironensis]|nr:hypothetical protein KR018_011326 [Drosophila ironensis]